jgi:hypothetical protein
MSTEDHPSDCTDTEHPPKGTDLKAGPFRVGQAVEDAVSQGHDLNDQFVEATDNHAEDLVAWFDAQNLSRVKAIITAWFFLPPPSRRRTGSGL